MNAEPRPYLRHPACWRARNKANGPSRQISESLPTHFLSSRWGSVGRASYHLQNSASSSKFRPPTILPTIWSSAMPSCTLSRAPSASRPHPRLPSPLPEIRSVFLLPPFVPSASNASWSLAGSANITPNPHLQPRVAIWCSVSS